MILKSKTPLEATSDRGGLGYRVRRNGIKSFVLYVSEVNKSFTVASRYEMKMTIGCYYLLDFSSFVNWRFECNLW